MIRITCAQDVVASRKVGTVVVAAQSTGPQSVATPAANHLGSRLTREFRFSTSPKISRFHHRSRNAGSSRLLYHRYLKGMPSVNVMPDVKS